MPIAPERKSKVVSEYRIHGTDSGSPEVQVAVLTTRINELAEHLDGHAKDNHSRRGLIRMVSRRNRLLRYLARADRERYLGLISRLGLRK
ncbi:MAG: 30S ribosomal protein S15 [Phycisphaeraceae bacterium]|nr:30S ribosomal protein S15 [Phycisphaeraceae bacterium]